jgi:hypothetical protein
LHSRPHTLLKLLTVLLLERFSLSLYDFSGVELLVELGKDIGSEQGGGQGPEAMPGQWGARER